MQSPPARAIPDKTPPVLIRRIRANPCSIPASGAKPACAGYTRLLIQRPLPFLRTVAVLREQEALDGGDAVPG